MKKKIGIGVILLLVIIIGFSVIRSGGKISGIMISDYSISEDGSVMTLSVGLSSSIGYIRTLKASDDGTKILITFYSTYGFNSNIGAKNEFQVQLQPSCNEIYFYSGNGEYKLKLQKNIETNDWEEVRY